MIPRELDNVRVAFDVLPNGKKAPKGHQFVRCHMVFNIKMEDSDVRLGFWQEAP